MRVASLAGDLLLGRLACKQHQQREAEGEGVDLGGGGSRLEVLGRHVDERAGDARALPRLALRGHRAAAERVSLRLHRPSHAEVADAREAAALDLLEEDVGRLDVAMHHAAGEERRRR